MNNSHDLLGAYCTDALDPQERVEFEAHLAQCGTCRAEAAEFREVLAALADAAPVHPPPALEDDVVARATADAPRSPAPGPGDHAARRARRRWSRTGTWLAATAAGLLLFAAGVGVGRTQLPGVETTTASRQMADVVAVASAADAHIMDVDIMGTTSRLVMSDEMDKSVFLASELPMPAKGMCYQIWLVTDDGQMVSAGAFTPDTDGNIATVLEGTPSGVQKAMITMEPPGGSDHPTGEMLGEVAA